MTAFLDTAAAWFQSLPPEVSYWLGWISAALFFLFLRVLVAIIRWGLKPVEGEDFP